VKFFSMFFRLSRFLGTGAAGALVLSGFAGCATYVPIKSVRPPTIDTSGIRRLAVRPFENNSGIGGPAGAQITRYLSETSERIVRNTGKFVIVAPTDPNADGVFTGQLRSLITKDKQERLERKNKDGEITVEIRYFREVSLEFSYSVISTRTDLPIGTIVKQGSNNSSGSDRANITDTLTLAKHIVDSQISGLTRDIVPTIVASDRKLMNETSKDKVLKRRMKEALAFVKNGSYEEAVRQFDAIYYEYGSAAAGTNAAILRESIASDAAARAELTRLFTDTNGFTDRAVRNAVDTLYAKLPPEANIMIIKTISTERNLLDYVINQMTKTVVQEGRLRVIDRSNQALINAEQQYQLSGNVDDNSAVSIGHQLGVQYIVICWISGEKSLRRFNQKTLNVETGHITDQIDFEI